MVGVVKREANNKANMQAKPESHVLAERLFLERTENLL
jgi:hypothetical protein